MAPELECKKRLTLGERCVIRVGGETFPVSRLVELLRISKDSEPVEDPPEDRVILPMRPVETVVKPPIAKPAATPKPATKTEPWPDVVWPDYDERMEAVEEVGLKDMGIVGPIARTLEANGLTTRRAIIAHGDLTSLLGALVAGTVGRIVSDWKP